MVLVALGERGHRGLQGGIGEEVIGLEGHDDRLVTARTWARAGGRDDAGSDRPATR
jgi:hypothetical protein